MKKASEKWVYFRIRTVLVFFCLITLAVGSRAIVLQVIKKDELFALAEKQYRKKIPLVPKRGTIYSRGYEELAVTVEVDSVYAEPANIQNPARTAKKLAPLLSLSQRDIEERLSSSKSFVWLERKVSPSLIEKIGSLNLQGIAFTKENRRFYPNGELASHVIGFSGIDGDGLGGIELSQNSQIKGKVAFVRASRDAMGKRTLPNDFAFEESLEGNSIVLTIDKTIQFMAEKELAKAVKDTGAKGGTALVMDPKTGEILAMVSYPQFNPNNFSAYPQEALKNKVIVDSYEPGSTLKVFLIAAGIEEGVIKPSDRFYCENGAMKVANRVIHDTKKHGTLTVTEIMKVSSNIGMVKIAEKLGKETYYDYLTAFGFGVTTGLELKGEGTGILRSHKNWRTVDFANISFGQGISATPVQLATSFSSIANGGYLMKPYIIKDVRDMEGRVIKSNRPQIVRKIISGETVSKVSEILREAVNEGGTGAAAALTGYAVAGKTGTSQKLIDNRYARDKHIASFIGFVPADSPELVVLVTIDEPEGIQNQYGGIVAAPVFKAIAEGSLRYLNTPRSYEKEGPKNGAMKIAKIN